MGKTGDVIDIGRASRGPDYFRKHWVPTLGSDAGWLVLGLRALANEQGIIHASQEEIARESGLPVRTVQRLFATTDSALHRGFVLSKTPRYAARTERGGVSRLTDEIRVALDNPIHPDDARFHVRQIGGNGNAQQDQSVEKAGAGEVVQDESHIRQPGGDGSVVQDQAVADDCDEAVAARRVIAALFSGAPQPQAERIRDGEATERSLAEMRRRALPEFHSRQSHTYGTGGAPDPDLLRSVSGSDSGRHFTTPLSGSDPKSKARAGTGSTFLKRVGSGTDLIYDRRPAPQTLVPDSASKQGRLWRDSRVTRLSREQVDAAKHYADDIGCWLDEKSGKESAGFHPYRRLHLAAIFFLGAKYTREAQMTVDDDLANARAGHRAPIHNPSRYFWGVCRGKAAEHGIDLKAESEDEPDRQLEASP